MNVNVYVFSANRQKGFAGAGVEGEAFREHEGKQPNG